MREDPQKGVVVNQLSVHKVCLIPDRERERERERAAKILENSQVGPWCGGFNFYTHLSTPLILFKFRQVKCECDETKKLFSIYNHAASLLFWFLFVLLWPSLAR